MIDERQAAAYDGDERTVLPASYAQELLFLLYRAAPESAAYNVPRTVTLHGSLDRAALQRAFDALVTRHEILRTTYDLDGDEAVQIIHSTQPVAVEVFDVRARPAANRDAEVARIVRAGAARAFDLTREAPFRVTLIACAEDVHVLQIATHHIASDGWSGEILMRELAAGYAAAGDGAADVLPALPIQYGDYAVWEREHLTGDALRDDLAYWRAALHDADTTIRIPSDYPPSARPGAAATSASLVLTRQETDALKALGRRHDATLYMTLLAGYHALLHRLTGAPDSLVGSPVAGRSRPETHALIGYFANTIVQRARFAADTTFAELLAAVRAASLDAFDHQNVPFEKLVLELHAGRAVGHTPLFNVVFTMLNDERTAPATLGGLALVPFDDEHETTKFDLTLFAAEGTAGVTLTLRGRADMFRAATLAAMLRRLGVLLCAAAAEPDAAIAAIPLLDADERGALDRWNATGRAYGDGTVVTMIDEAAARTPARPALHCGDRVLSYADLRAQTDALARRLRAAGVGPGGTVAVVLDRSIELIVAIVGVMKAGAAYVPLAPDAPPERLRAQARAARVAAVVTLEAHTAAHDLSVLAIALDRAAGDVPDGAIVLAPPSASDLAYVVFTSGSSGVPKGVAVTHGNLANYVRGIARVFASEGSGDAGDPFAPIAGWRFGMVSTPTADLGNTVLFPALCAGATLTLIPREVATDAHAFAAALAREPLDVLKITPAHFRALADGAAPDAAIVPREWLVFGGEALPWPLAESVLQRANAPRVLNHYGPTEATVGATTFAVTADAAARARELGARTVPIGRPLPNVRLHVLDAAQRAVPAGVPGELFIAGAGVVRGYFDEPQRTAESFPTIAGLGRVYRTGDRVRRLENGEVEFLGRLDDQVKIRGYRVEPGEIEAVLRAHAEIAQAAVIAAERDGETRLIAYVVATADAAGESLAASARSHLAARVPDYLIPSAVIVLPALPLTANGKLDRAALAAHDDAAPAAPRVVEVLTPTETALVAIWNDVLQCDRACADDDFFALGGHSLLAIRVLGKISRQFGVRLPLRAIFDTPVLRELASVVDFERALAGVEELTDDQAAALLRASAGPSRV